jgi:hypothetical protein
MKFQSALVAVAFADIEPLKRLNALVRSRFQTTEFIIKGLGINNSYHQS